MKSIKITKWIKKNKSLLSITLIILLFPIMIGFIYALPLPQIIAVKSVDLLAYYGTSLGILSSFILYRYEKKKNNTNRLKEICPVFFVDVSKSEDADILVIIIKNLSTYPLKYMYLYDEYVDQLVKKDYEL